jgi:hypothetical protein
MKKIIPIYGSNDITIYKISYPEKDINSFIYTHETRYEGKFVAVLPYKIIEDRIQYLLKKDMVYCWSDKQPILYPINYGFESKKFENMEVSIRNKIFEEIGYNIDINNDIIDLGTAFNNTSSDSEYYLFAIDLTDIEKSKTVSSTCIWVDSIEDANDTISYTLHYKLLRYLKQID